MPPSTPGLILAAALWLATPAHCETVSVPGYEIHYSVFTSAFLSPQVAAHYGIVRGRERAVINVAVRRPSARAEGEAQAAIVSGSVFDLVHRRALEFVEIREQGAVYYLAQFPFRDRETLYFSIQVQADPAATPQDIQFEKTMYRE